MTSIRHLVILFLVMNTPTPADYEEARLYRRAKRRAIVGSIAAFYLVLIAIQIARGKFLETLAAVAVAVFFGVAIGLITNRR